MIIKDKVIEIFFITDDFCNIFNDVMLKYVIKSNKVSFLGFKLHHISNMKDE